MFRGRKQYGQSKVSTCPFCPKEAYHQNSQGLLVCKDHTKKTLPDIKCVCGEWLDIRSGKWGPFFTCFKCGVIPLKRALEFAESGKGVKVNKAKKKSSSQPLSEEAKLAQKFEEMAKTMKKKEDLPTIDDLAEKW